MTISKCFYVPGQRTIVDAARANDAGEYVGVYGKRTLEQLAEEHPGVKLCDLDSAVDEIRALRDAHYCTAPVEVSRDRYHEMLEVLPPCKWASHRGAQGFFVSEALSADIHTWFVKIGERYWELNRSCMKSTAEVIDEVAAAAGRAMMEGRTE